MKINAVEIRPGNILEYEGGIWKTVKIQHTQPGKGGVAERFGATDFIDASRANVSCWACALRIGPAWRVTVTIRSCREGACCATNVS